MLPRHHIGEASHIVAHRRGTVDAMWWSQDVTEARQEVLLRMAFKGLEKGDETRKSML